MASTTHTETVSETRREARAGYPPSSARFDLMMTLLSALFIAGLWIDGWAHFHDRVDDSFFTPWHALFYGAFGIVALTLGWRQWRGVSSGHAFSRALPKGYGPSLIGVAVFAFGGVFDMIWHTLFGIEGGTEALLSPSHMILAAGMMLVFTGPIRSAWSRAAEGETLTGWRALFPLLLCMTIVLTLLMFFTSYAHPMTMPLAHRPLSRAGLPFRPQDFGVTGILLESGILAAVTGLLLYRWRLPFGAITLLAGVSAAMLTILVDSYVFLPPLFAALLIVELIAWRLKPSPERPAAFVFVMALIPLAVYAAYFFTIATQEQIVWSIHVWTGAITLAGIVGALVGYVMIGLRSASHNNQQTP